mmetsp:Transcript_49451/g.98202  ORF Transcript_49451/g.98202 Transcript_49451/m.98202 type:complete len:236 (-) Transcript_49451:262-969(-)
MVVLEDNDCELTCACGGGLDANATDRAAAALAAALTAATAAAAVGFDAEPEDTCDGIVTGDLPRTSGWKCCCRGCCCCCRRCSSRIWSSAACARWVRGLPWLRIWRSWLRGHLPRNVPNVRQRLRHVSRSKLLPPGAIAATAATVGRHCAEPRRRCSRNWKWRWLLWRPRPPQRHDARRLDLSALRRPCLCTQQGLPALRGTTARGRWQRRGRARQPATAPRRLALPEMQGLAVR